MLGLPWFVATTVESLANIDSLRMETSPVTPGKRPVMLGIKEQRVSNFLISLFVGISVLLEPVLQYLPMPVLYGLLAFTGYSALKQMELLERIRLIFTPPRWRPQTNYLRQVRLSKIHLFTLIQILCVGLLWVGKSFARTTLLFSFSVNRLPAFEMIFLNSKHECNYYVVSSLTHCIFTFGT